MTGLPVPVQAAQAATVALTDPMFVSDLHLSVPRLATCKRFERFLRLEARDHAELVILGDLFEFWIGDDAPDPVGVRVAAGLRALVAEEGTRIYLMHGNRDLLLGRAFCKAAGVTLLQDPTVATFTRLGGRRALLAHGDAYCLDDEPYQAFRRQVRDPAFQADFLARPAAERLAIARQARAASEAGKAEKTMTIMDVRADAIDAALDAAGHDLMIHGHTHRPATHEWTRAGQSRTRIVLPDWDFEGTTTRGGALVVRDGEFVVQAL